MRVLVTGGSGFLGKYVLDRLKLEGHSILSLYRKKNEEEGVGVLVGDLNDLEPIKEKIIDFQPEVIIHLAWQGIPDFSSKISQLNLDLSISFLNFILDNTSCRKVVVAGSCWEYGKKFGKCQEDDLISVNSFFAWAKTSLYKYLSIKCDEVGASLVWFRIFYLFGPKQRGKSLIPTLIRCFRQNKPPNIKSPLNRNDFVYVDDAASIIQKSLSSSVVPGIYNIGSGQSTSVYKISKIIEKLITQKSNFSDEILEKGTNQETVNFWACTTKLRNLLPFDQKTTLELGIDKTIQEGK